VTRVSFWRAVKGRSTLVVAASVLASSCMVGPNYRRPAVETPATYRDVAGATASTGPESLADLQWFELFRDDTLTGIVNTALKQNFDLQIAAERVLQARDQFRITRTNLFPVVGGSVSVESSRASEVSAVSLPSGVDPEVSSGQAGFSLGWELDVWGRLRRLNESARAQYLATEEARYGVITTLVADVTQTYLTLRALDLQLQIAQRTRQIGVDSLRLTELRRDRGVATSLDVRQAEQLLYTATGQIAGLEREVTQTENALSLLLGRAPGDVVRGQALEAFQAPPVVPAGLPSSLLGRRPDIRQAEQELVAANAEIGVAKAEYFPRISLTGFFGVESRALSDLLTARARTWTVAASAAAPIFNAGRTRATVRLAESVQRELVVNYQRAIYAGLREVSDALAGYRKTSEQRTEQERLVGALLDATRLSTQRYEGGLDSYLQVLDAERNRFQSELDLAAIRRLELASIVELYRALGGGWSAQP
jgi:NodT family efflux transporter outer membrane factor (OMF) lipoprotein